MGALAGSISVRRYRVTDPLPADPRAKLARGLRAHAFAPLDPKGEADRALGWVSIDDHNDAELRADKLFFVAAGGEQLRVALRIDVLKPPPAEVKRQLRTRVAAMESAEGRPLTRREKSALKDEVVRLLRQRSFPRVRVVDMVWNLDSGQLWFWSQTKSVNELFVGEFVRACGLRLDVDGPARWTRRSAAAERLGRLEPTPELWRGFAGLRPLSSTSQPGEDA
jgi:DNA recombination-dependent growth factor C